MATATERGVSTGILDDQDQLQLNGCEL